MMGVSSQWTRLWEGEVRGSCSKEERLGMKLPRSRSQSLVSLSRSTSLVHSFNNRHQSCYCRHRRLAYYENLQTITRPSPAQYTALAASASSLAPNFPAETTAAKSSHFVIKSRSHQSFAFHSTTADHTDVEIWTRFIALITYRQCL